VVGMSVPVAFVLVSTEADAMEDVLGALKSVEEVKEAYSVYGVYDIIVKIEADSMLKLNNAVSYKIRRISKVRSTLTMVVM
jgi:Lrp/AsnC family transcriptional regulator for asnA, asnC and gidA